MQLSRKSIVIAGFTAGIFLAVAATKPGDPPEKKFKNLKVLPRNIDSKKLLNLMVDEFQGELGVSCNFCHSEDSSYRPDYASDEKPEKQIARAMMEMTMNINKKYFKLKRPAIGDSSLVVTCGTCHRGKPHPDPMGP